MGSLGEWRARLLAHGITFQDHFQLTPAPYCDALVSVCACLLSISRLRYRRGPPARKQATMGEKIDEFSKKLRDDLTAADNRLQDLKGQVENANQETREAIQAKLDQAKANLDEQKRKAEDRQQRIKSYLDDKVTETQHDINDWKTKREIKKLERRAERREGYAADTVLIAMAAIDEANFAVLEALEARFDAEDAQGASA